MKVNSSLYERVTFLLQMAENILNALIFYWSIVYNFQA